MGENSEIAWTDHTFNPWIGCTKVSAGCLNCYAERDFDKRRHFAKWGDDGTRVKTSPANWLQPMRWDRKARDEGKRKRVFCASLADVGENRRPELMPWRQELEELIYLTPHLDWLLLTKRPENMPKLYSREILETCWVGTTVEDRKVLDQRVMALHECPAACHFVSFEPLLEDLGQIRGYLEQLTNPWVIVGGESGPKARPCNVEWIRSIVQQCKAAGVSCFVKQLGANCGYAGEGEWFKGPQNTSAEECGYHGVRTLRHPKGGDMEEWPADLRVREVPR